VNIPIALFDLDHTLIPFDSGNVFTRFLIERGVLDAAFERGYLDYCRQYAAGTLDMAAMHRFTVGSMAMHSHDTIADWVAAFESSMAASVPQASIALVARHRKAGHRCAIVTATTRFIAEPFGRLLGLPVVLATEPALGDDGHYTGETLGPPCFRADKLVHVNEWLAREGSTLAQAQRSWFYSDSINDLALLEAVTDPVAVRPDAALAAHALRRGWPVLVDGPTTFDGTIAHA
jgi:HAD superfamily hydrolase (TIGR01490 family)